MLDDSRRSLKCEAGYAHPPTGRGTRQHSAQIEHQVTVEQAGTVSSQDGAVSGGCRSVPALTRSLVAQTRPIRRSSSIWASSPWHNGCDFGRRKTAEICGSGETIEDDARLPAPGVVWVGVDRRPPEGRQPPPLLSAPTPPDRCRDCSRRRRRDAPFEQDAPVAEPFADFGSNVRVSTGSKAVCADRVEGDHERVEAVTGGGWDLLLIA